MFCRNTRSLWSQSCLTVISLSCKRRLWSVSYLYSDNYMRYPKVFLIFHMQFPFLPEGVKWKVVKNIHCPPLLIDTGLMSIGPLTKKLLQKHRPVSYSKKQRKLALSPRSLAESSAQSELSRLDAHWDRLCGLVLNYIKGKLWKIRLWNMISFALLAVILFRFFWGKSIWSYCCLSLNVSRISKTKPT